MLYRSLEFLERLANATQQMEMTASSIALFLKSSATISVP